MAPFTIYEVRENDAEFNGFEMVVESRSLRHFQTELAAQIYLQEVLNRKLAARMDAVKNNPNSVLTLPESIAALAANKLHYHPTIAEILEDVEYSNIELGANPLLFIKELIVYP